MPPAAPSKPFFATLDAIRGVAAILVMMRHVPYFTTFQESYLAVDVFFLLSGVVLANAYERRLLQGLSIVRFTLMRVVRIYPLYLLGCALMLLAWYPDQLAAWGSLLSMLALAGLLLPNLAGDPPFPLNHPAWSLFFEILANVFYAAIAPRLNTRRLRLLIAVSALGLGWTLLKSAHTGLDLGWSCATLGYGVVRVAYSFFAGVLLYRSFVVHSRGLVQALASRPWIGHGLPWLIVAAVSAILMAAPVPAWRAGFDFAVVVAVFPALIYLALCLPEKSYGAPLARGLGLVSFPLYALHVPLYNLTAPLLKSWADSDGIGPGIFFIGGLLPLCGLLNRYFDIPVRRYLLAGAENGYARLSRLKIRPTRK